MVDTQQSSKRSRRNKHNALAKKALKQANILEVIHSDSDKYIPREVIKSTIVFVGGGDRNNPYISSQLPRHRTTPGKNKKEQKCMRIISLSDGDLSSTQVQLEHQERDLILPGSPTHIPLVPRVDSLKWTVMHQ